jgi:hypothetical protein
MAAVKGCSGAGVPVAPVLNASDCSVRDTLITYLEMAPLMPLVNTHQR